jgi:antitoxin MazE
VLLSVVQIGNSKGIRIPKAILQQCGIGKELDLQVESGRIVLKPRKGTSRDGWAEAFSRMANASDDRLLIDDGLDLDLTDLSW